MRIAVYRKDPNYQVRVSGYSAREEKQLRAKLNLDPIESAIVRMDEYEDLRGDDYFVVSGKAGKEICFTCPGGRLAFLREMLDETPGAALSAGEEFIPSSEDAKRTLSREDSVTEELTHIMEANLPFYKKGPAALIKGSAVRLGVLIVVLVVARAVYLAQADHYEPRSLQAVMKTTEQPFEGQNYFAYFLKPHFSHRSNLRIKRPLYIRGNNVILEGGFYVKIEGIGNLKASIEAHNNAPVTLKLDTREGNMRVNGIYVGEEMVSPRGELKYLGRIPVSGSAPSRVDALDTEARGAYVRVRDADPLEEATFGWMLGQTVSVTARLSNEGDRYIIGEDEFRFVIPREGVKPEIQEIMDMAAANNERAIVDMRLANRPFPLRNRRNPREQRKDTNIVTTANMHFITVQSAVLKNI